MKRFEPNAVASVSQQFFICLAASAKCMSRGEPGSKLDERELLISYFDFQPAMFLAHGRPLQIYADYHSILFTHDPDALPQLF